MGKRSPRQGMRSHRSRTDRESGSFLRSLSDGHLQRHDQQPATDVDNAHRAEQQAQLGIRSLQAGRLQDAREYLESAIRTDRRHALAHNCLGIVYRSLGNVQRAIECYQSAIRSEPHYAEAHNNLGIAYEAIGENEHAVACYRAALTGKPSFAAAHNNLGNALTKLGRYDEAIGSFDAALRNDPSLAAAVNNRGLALRELGHAAEAEDCFRRAVGIQPDLAEAYLNLGNLLRDRGSTDAASECYLQAVDRKPRYGAAQVALGGTYLELGHLDRALTTYLQATQVAPDDHKAWHGLGIAQKQLGMLDQSVQSYRRAAQVKPDDLDVLTNLGSLLSARGELDEAISVLRQAALVAPEQLTIHNDLGNFYRLQDRMEEAAASYATVLRGQQRRPVDELRLSTLCPAVFRSRDEMDAYYHKVLHEWRSLQGAAQYSSLSELMKLANEPPYNLQFFAENVCDLKQAYANIFEYRGPRFELPSPGPRVRIGCVVTEKHEVAFLRLIWSTLKQLAPDEFSLTILCHEGAASKFRSTIGEDAADVVALPGHPDEVVEAVHSGGFDILYYFEVGTDSWNYFLPFLRLAPVQCTSWGIQVTSGIPNMDYYLSSGLVEPDGADAHYSERLIRAGTLLSYQTPIQLPSRVKTRSQFGFSERQTIYLCAQHLGKFHPDFDEILASLLREDPDGVLVTVGDRHGYGAKRLQDRWACTIPDVTSRMIVLGRQALPDYLCLVAAADVLLDAPHFGGVNSSYDAFALDRPVVCLPSQFHRGRYTLGCYHKMELLDYVADDRSTFVQIATRLGREEEYRHHARDQIQQHKHLLFGDRSSVDEHARIFHELVREG